MRYLYLFFISLFLAGCTAKTEYVYIKEKEAVNVPKNLFIHPKVPAPINKYKYLALTTSEKEIALGTYILSLQKTIKSYKLVIDNIEQFIDEHKEIIKRLSEENKNESIHK